MVASNASDINKGTSGAAKNNSGESAYDPVIDVEVEEVPEAKSKREETVETKTSDVKLERELDIKRCKEEIKFLEARIRELEFMVKAYSRSGFLLLVPEFLFLTSADIISTVHPL